MSRIFDALQRSGAEQSGVEYPDLMSVITEVFEAPRDQAVADRASAEPAAQVAVEQAPAVPATAATFAPAQFPASQFPATQLLADQYPSSESAAGPALTIDGLEFPSIDVSVTAGSRLVFMTEPDSLAAEKFRFLGVRLRQLQQSRTLKRVLVTSTIPEEGKSTVSANLAGVLARRKQRVLLIEGDLRRPVLAQEFGLGRLAGLGEWLQSKQQNVSNIYHLNGPGFWILPAGSPPANPLELMQSGRLSQLMVQLTTYFDWIVVDSPPLLPLADTTVWTRMTDGVLLVAREGRTEKKQLQRGLEILKKSDLLGVVLNGCLQSDHKNYYQRYAPKNEVTR
jgi:capsular exopolysaccharide synthesis family protein